MECPECRAENSETRKFCRECGHKLSLVCPECGTENTPGDKFCGECGNKFLQPEPPKKELSFDEKIEKIQKYLPKGLTEKILAQRDRIEGERRQVTVMFCDMEGFTPLVEQQGAESAYGIMDQVYELLIHKVHDFEGTINEMTGDGIMALFGAPIALEDAPQRAIRSAYAIHKEMARLNDRLKKDQKGIPPLKMRIGIHSGPVVVGTLGNNLRVEFKAVGDTVNIASRMEGLAEPGTIYVTGDTFKLTEGFFRFEALGDKRIKGKETPVAAYRVIAPSTRKTRFDVNAERGLTSFVGRNRELELLLDSLERVKEGAGQAFSIVGEAGIGKSRFLYEFRKLVSSEDITFLEGKCLSYGKGIPYHPIIDILKGNFEIGENDIDDEIRKKVKSGLESLNADQGATLPYLLRLLGVKDSGIDGIQMSPEGRKDRIFEAIKQIIFRGAQIRPLIIAIEDLHWADQSTEEALKLIIETIPAARVLIIFTCRPEFKQKWRARSYHNQITLNRFSNRESIIIASKLLDTISLKSELQRLILDKTDGVPFFIEEFIKVLQKLDIIDIGDNKIHIKGDLKSISIPSTIQDMIMARVDGLSDTAKTVLQIGSVIEREFDFAVMMNVTDLSEKDLLTHISELKDAELLYERGIYPRVAYIFRHALTREVVYGSILLQRRKALHNKIGCAIENINKNNIYDYSGILVDHFIDGENYEKAAKFSKSAYRIAQKQGALKDAIAYAKKQIDCLEKIEQSKDRDIKLISARVSLSTYCTLLNLHRQAQEAIEPITDLAYELNYIESYPCIDLSTGTYHALVKEDFKAGLRLYKQAIKNSEKTGDMFNYWMAKYFIAFMQSMDCAFNRSDKLFGKLIEMSEASKAIAGICYSRGTRATWNYLLRGNINASYDECKINLEMSIKSEDNHIKAMAYSSYGAACFAKGYLKRAKTNLLEAESLCERTNHGTWGAWACQILGEYFIGKGEYNTACKYFEKQIHFIEMTESFVSWKNIAESYLARAKARDGAKDIDLKLIHKYKEKNNLKVCEGMFARAIAEIHMASGNMREAEEWILEAKRINRQNKVLYHLALDHVTHLEIIKQMDNNSKFRRELIETQKIFNVCGSDGWVRKYDHELSKL